MLGTGLWSAVTIDEPAFGGPVDAADCPAGALAVESPLTTVQLLRQDEAMGYEVLVIGPGPDGAVYTVTVTTTAPVP